MFDPRCRNSWIQFGALDKLQVSSRAAERRSAQRVRFLGCTGQVIETRDSGGGSGGMNNSLSS